MRIYISGTAGQGKSTLVKDFLHNWPMYRESQFNYRNFLGENHSKKTNTETQIKILEGMLLEIKTWRRNTNIIMDRGPLDNFIYSVWALEKGASDISDDFMSECVKLVRESMRNVDIIFWIPFQPHIKIENDGKREVDLDYIMEIDNLFEQIFKQVSIPGNKSILFPEDDSPCMIEMSGSREERLNIISQYIGNDGRLKGGSGNIIDPNELAQLERMLLHK